MGFITDKYPKFKFAIDMVFLGLFIILIISAQSAYNMGLKNGIIYCMSRCALCPEDMNEDVKITNICKPYGNESDYSENTLDIFK